MKKLISTFTPSLVLFAAALCLTGCTTPLQRVSDQSLGEKHVFYKNYQIGQPKTVSVGDQIVRVEDYFVEEYESQVVSPTKSVTLTGGIVSTSLQAGKKYKFLGFLTYDGVRYGVADSESTHKVLIRPDGSLHNRVVAPHQFEQSGQYIQVAYTMEISDPSTRIIRDAEARTNQKKGYENYEILYSGKSGNSMHLTYREYTPDGMARAAYQQPLIYEANAKSITFKKFQITVHSATSNDITFTVADDGYGR